jgi:hypothetical protein
MENSNGTIGNRTRDHSACSAVPQPTFPQNELSYYFFFNKNLFARSKYTHFSTGKYKNCSWSTNLPAEHSLCEDVTVLSRQGMEGTAVKNGVKL